uniref:Uncharacterized protein n=1 Tax=Fagus sylvatica TaxID=28930 RepID=A0A2N9GEE4_FAGSY
MAKTKKTQGKLARYVNTPEAMEKFRRHYGVPDDVYLEYRFWEDAITGEPGDLIIPVVAVIEGGVRFPMDPLLADFLDYFRISPSQISPNIFRIVNGVAELNRRLGFNLTVHDIIATYFLRTTQHEAFSLRPRDVSNTLVNSLPDTNKEMMDDFLLVRGNWYFPGHRCPTRDGKPEEQKKHIQAHLTDPVALQAVYDSEVCVDEYANPRSAYKLLRYIPSARSFLQCRQVRNLAEALANPANKSPPAHDIRAMAGIQLEGSSYPPRPQAETSEPILPLKRKRKGVPKGEASQAATPVSSRTLLQLPRQVPEARPVLPGVDTLPSTEDADVEMESPGLAPASALCEVARLPVDMDVWSKSTNQEVINNLRRGLMMAVQGSLEIGDRFMRQTADLENSLRVATRSVHLKTEAERMRREVEAYKEQVRIATLKKEEADLKLEDSQDLLKKALEENSKAGDKILALEAEITELGRGQLLTGDVLPYPNAPIGVPEEELPEVQPANDDVAGPSNS